MTVRRWAINSKSKKSLAALAATVLAAVILVMALPPETAGVEDREPATLVQSDEYRFLEGTELETAVTVITGKKAGAAIYVVAGLHGDERAGWIAADRLRNISLEAGTLYVVSPANRYGAEQDKRLTKEERDLNRNFPGDPKGCDAERIAAAVYEDINEKAPVLVLDLHEARPEEGEQDALGNSLICQSLDGISDMVLELMEESGRGVVGSSPLTLYGSPPMGSINRVVTQELQIPVITVETFREEELEQRIENHLEIVGFILEFYGLR